MTTLHLIEREVKQVIHQIPPLPGVVMRLIELVDSENATAEQVESLIVADPVLTAKVLHLANSAYYGLSRSISTIKQALLVLGFHAVKNLALGIAAITVLKNGRTPTARELELWEHSFLCAGIARELMLRTRRGAHKAEEAFMGGLLHEIGAVVLMTRFPTEYQKVLEYAPRHRGENLSLSEAERQLLETDHAQVGGLLAERWELPEGLVEVIASHHAPALPDNEHAPVIASVMLGDFWSHQQHGGTEFGFALVPPPVEASQKFALPESEREALLQHIGEQARAMRQIVVG
jgi:HD-like signal output (HDOD) protein